MPRPMHGLLVAALVAGAFMAGRWSRDASNAGDASVAAAGVAEEAPGVQSGPLATGSADGAARMPAGTPGHTKPVPRVGDAPQGAMPPPVPEVPVSPQAPGPQPLRSTDRRLLEKAERRMVEEGGATADMLDLARDEQPDADAARIEALIAQTIRARGGRYVALRLDPPRCTRSVCLMRGVGEGGAGVVARSDWQRLSSVLMNEPWFREVFDDMRGTVGMEGGDTVYITLYVRCAPGQCRFGNR